MKKLFAFTLILLFCLVSPSPASAGKWDLNPDPEVSRVFWTPTALQDKPGDASATNFDLVIWNIDYTFSDNFSLGVRTVTPFGFFVVGPMFKVTGEISPNVHLGLLGEVGFLTLFVADDNGDTTAAYYGGGGPILTIGNEDRLLNLSAIAYRGGNENGGDYIFIPNIGGSIRLSQRVKFNAELLVLYHHEDPWRNYSFLYGLRIFGDRIYGDLGFVMPFAGGMKDFYRFMPLGFPLLSLGIAW